MQETTQDKQDKQDKQETTQEITNFQQKLQFNKDIILLTDKDEQFEEISGIQIPLYQHQKKLIKELINYKELTIKTSNLKCQNLKCQNYNLWIKGDIGTGKSLVFLSLIQHQKNCNYKDFPSRVPYKQDILQTTDYSSIHNYEYVKHEIMKPVGFCLSDYYCQSFITYKNVRKQALLLVQHQVFSQFEQYIVTQTKLTYFPIQNHIQFIKYLYDFNSIEEDIILWDTDTIKVDKIFLSLSQALYLAFPKEKEQQIISKKTYLESVFGLNVSFNMFWTNFVNKMFKSCYAYVAYDDFDTINIPQSEAIPAIYYVFIGSTMIQSLQSNINHCFSFIQNKTVNKLSSFRIKPQIVQQILQLPPVIRHDIVCKTPSNTFTQFMLLQYVNIMFSIIQNKIYSDKNESGQDFLQISPLLLNQLFHQKTTLDKIYKEYIMQYTDLFSYSSSFSFEILVQIMCQVTSNIHYDKIEKKQHKTEKDKIQQQLLLDYVNGCEYTAFIDILLTHNETYPNFFEELSKILPKFSINQQQIQDNMLFDIITNKEIQYNKCCFPTCCGQLINVESIHNSFIINNNQYTCYFCGQPIKQLTNFIYNFSGFIDVTNYTTATVLQKPTNSKFQQVIKLVKENKDCPTLLYITEQDVISKFNQQLDVFVPPVFNSEKEIIDWYDYNRPLFYYNYEAEQQIFEQQLIQFTQGFLQKHKIPISVRSLNMQKTPDVYIISSLKQITGENMTYIDNFIFYNKPSCVEEKLQIIGRSSRIGREKENHVYSLYYPSEERIY